MAYPTINWEVSFSSFYNEFTIDDTAGWWMHFAPTSDTGVEFFMGALGSLGMVIDQYDYASSTSYTLVQHLSYDTSETEPDFILGFLGGHDYYIHFTNYAEGSQGASSWTTEAAMPDVVSSGTHNAFPGLVRLSDSSLLSVWRNASAHGAYDGVIQQATSLTGVEWSTPVTIATGGSGFDSRDPCLTMLANGTLVCTYFERQSGGDTKVYFQKSSDSGTTWQTRVIVTSGTACSAPIVELSGGRLLQPVYTGSAALIYYSDDEGITWALLSTIMTNAGVGTTVSEPWVTNHSGTLLALVRTDGAHLVLRSTSTDNGATWSTPDSLWASDSRVASIYTDDGNIYSFYRDYPNFSQLWMRTNFTDPVLISDQDYRSTYCQPVQLEPNAVGLRFSAEDSSLTTSILYYLQPVVASTPGRPEDPAETTPVLVSDVNFDSSLRRDKLTLPVWFIGVGPWQQNNPNFDMAEATGRSLTFRLKQPDSATFSYNGDASELQYATELNNDAWWVRNGELLHRGRISTINDDVPAPGDYYTTTLSSFDYSYFLTERVFRTRAYNDDSITMDPIAFPGWKPIDILQWLLNNTETQNGLKLGFTYNQWSDLGLPPYERSLTGVDDPDSVFVIKEGDVIGDLISKMQSIAPTFDFWIDPWKRYNVALQRGADKGTVLDYGGTIASFTRSFNRDDYKNIVVGSSEFNGVSMAPVWYPKESLEGTDKPFGYPLQPTHGYSGLVPVAFADQHGVARATYPPNSIPEGGYVDIRSIDAYGKPVLLDKFTKQEYEKTHAREGAISVVFSPGKWYGPSHVFVGDTVTFIAKRGRFNFHDKMRVVSVTINIDDSGFETVSMELNYSRNDLAAIKNFFAMVKQVKKAAGK